jgi:hypothetical protein
MENQEEDFVNEEEIIKTVKAKRIPSEAQLKHLENIRGKALIKKQQMREVTEKAQLAKELDDKKVLKQKEKELLCQKYENHIKEKLEKEKEKEIVVEFENKKEEQITVPKQSVKPKKKIVKKIIYEEEESSSSSEEEVKEIIVHRKSKSKAKKEPVGPIEAEQIVVPPPKELSYNEMIYETSLGRIKNRINDERARTILHSVIPTYY